MGEGLDEGLNLRPPEECFELYRHKNAQSTRTRGWSGLYWARRNEGGDYEIRSVAREARHTRLRAASSRKGGFEEHYEKVNPP